MVFLNQFLSAHRILEIGSMQMDLPHCPTWCPEASTHSHNANRNILKAHAQYYVFLGPRSHGEHIFVHPSVCSILGYNGSTQRSQMMMRYKESMLCLSLVHCKAGEGSNPPGHACPRFAKSVCVRNSSFCRVWNEK